MPINHIAGRSISKVTRDLSLYLALSIGVVGIALYALFSGIEWTSFMRWFGLVGSTVVIYCFIISQEKHLWAKKSFWALMGLFFVVHCAVYAYLATTKVNLSGFKLAIIVIAESSLLNILASVIYKEREL